MKHVIIGSVLAAMSVTGVAAQEVTLGRFFGACEDAGTDTTTSTGEACIIQSIINAADAELDGITVTTLPTDWGNYYDQIKAAYAAGDPPDIHVMHAHAIPEFAGLGALADLSGDLEAAGIDTSDWAPLALNGVTYEGGIYGVPMDFHANLFHVNMELMAEAGLVNDDGTPMLPSSPEELLAQAMQFKEATGQNYLAADFAQFPIGVRLVVSMLWQQGSNIFDAEGNAQVDTPEARAAIQSIVQLFENDLADPQLNYADSQQAFLNGEAGILVNGTCVVDFYDAEAANPDVPLTDYYVADFPVLFDESATWAGSHIWAIPASLQRDDPETYQAALRVLAFIQQHNLDWARTGHMSVLNSVLESDAYNSLPHRDEYAATATMASDLPPTEYFSAMQDILNRELQAIWLTGKSVDDALSDAQLDIQDLLDS
jgi:multiple sugar transport system substrate-binding protein